MNSIIESVQPVISNSQNVFIDDQSIVDFIETIKKEEFEISEFDQIPQMPDPSDERYIGFAIVYNALNFCYWGNPKWSIQIGSKIYDGAYGLTQALLKGLQNGYDLLNPRCLENLKEDDLRRILEGNVEIPLFKERLIFLRELGKNINKQFNGSWIKVIEKGRHDAMGIVNVLVNDFPSIYRDEVNLNGHIIKFYKRAQLVPAYIDHDLSKTGVISTKILNISSLTAFADYKVPQVLRKLGILKYSKALSDKVDNLVPLESGSLEEIEIRANTIEAIERITQKARIKFPSATSARIDGIIWFRGQIKSPEDRPYHRVLTVWY